MHAQEASGSPHGELKPAMEIVPGWLPPPPPPPLFWLLLSLLLLLLLSSLLLSWTLFCAGVLDGAGGSEVVVEVDEEASPVVGNLLIQRFWRFIRRARTLWPIGREIKPAEISEAKANEINTEAIVIFIIDQNIGELWIFEGLLRGFDSLGTT
jgi:hypothetical protein